MKKPDFHNNKTKMLKDEDAYLSKLKYEGNAGLEHDSISIFVIGSGFHF